MEYIPAKAVESPSYASIREESRVAPKLMKIAYVGTYPPRECGIGTFTQHLLQAMVKPQTNGLHRDREAFVVALNDHNHEYAYPNEVKKTIDQEKKEDYLEAADFINQSRAEVCVVEHEYGIFGGHNGIYLLPLLYRLNMPIVVTLHTVLKAPSYNEKAVLKKICEMASQIVVMSHKAVEFLIDIYEVPHEKIALIEHGVPDIRFDRLQSKEELSLVDNKVLLTFGFLSRNKGIENVINALPKIIKSHPEALYIVAGKTHPHVLRHSGEEYREYLEKLVAGQGLENHVQFLNEYVDQEKLFKYLAACDIYITPYVNEAQITSGTLTYAMGVGCAAISTPYWHAEELLSNNRCKTFNFNDDEELADILESWLDDPESLTAYQQRAYEYGKELTWPKIGTRYNSMVHRVLTNQNPPLTQKNPCEDLSYLPPYSLAHVKRLTDHTGIIQHATFGIPNLKEGYCLDDNARALIAALMAYDQQKDPTALELIPTYLSFIHFLQRENGFFGNFMSFNRNCIDKIGSEDSFGRAIWALGYLLDNAPNDAYYQAGIAIFFHAAQNFDKLDSIRSIANTIIGLSYYLRHKPYDEGMVDQLRNLAYKLIQHYEAHQAPDWDWFESLLAYDNGILPLSLLHAAEILKDEKVEEIGLKTADFLTQVTMEEGYLSVIGNQEWFKRDGNRSVYAQQPIDALAMVLMFQQAFYLTKEVKYLHKMVVCHKWFLGENDLRISLYDHEPEGCCDGFESYGVNRNQGAESTLAYFISHLTVLQTCQAQ